ncbi:DUF2076 domain-containing protein [Bordetella genomosp. 7]|uniref:ABC transporter substrate-binding protein n=1 Tax=Bordetella genomosp. 7 TaxID=1416805 RepID=A0A261QWI0_9BORD|nr:DUF2076 family protein [Bordetella genomosp. 7]OZI17086.1 hypothetical protein CAL19_14650 [Bordetella genomosp. 7]
MQDQDRDAIASVFSRIQELERQGHPRDPDAEQLIRQEMQKNPGSAYYLAQTVLVQQQALQNAQARIQELQKNPSAAVQPSGSNPTAASPSTAFGRRAPAAGPAAGGLGTGFGRNNAAPAGGGFMAGALQTAVGVAGGMMLGNLLGSLFTGNEAQAAEAPPADEGAAPPYEDEGDFSDDGGDFEV